MRLILPLFAICLAAPAVAQTALPCDWQADVLNIAEPWEANTATFADGDVRVAMLDVAEPASAAFYLLILHPPETVPGFRHCTVVGLDDGLGYADMTFSDLDAGYDPETGLTLTVPAGVHEPEQSSPTEVDILVSVNQSSGDVTVSHQSASK